VYDYVLLHRPPLQVGINIIEPLGLTHFIIISDYVYHEEYPDSLTEGERFLNWYGPSSQI
jgi:hypothetical protein